MQLSRWRVFLSLIFALLLFLCRLYRSLGDYDVLRGIFTGHIGTKPITQDALEAEARGDFSQALKLYNEVTVYTRIKSCEKNCLLLDTLLSAYWLGLSV